MNLVTARRTIAPFAWKGIRAAGRVAGRRCTACGERAIYIPGRPVDERLAGEWQLTADEWADMNAREGMVCGSCRCNARARYFGEVIGAWARRACGAPGTPFSACAASPAFQSLVVAEINASHGLHQFLARSAGVRYSEFGSTDPSVPDESLLELSYPDDTFDLVLTSDTLEHVPDLGQALAEIRRVLKPGGVHLCTVPVLMSRAKTVQRAELGTDGVVRHREPPSYHAGPVADADDYLVFFEFGGDFASRLSDAGFDVVVHQAVDNPMQIVFETTKPVGAVSCRSS